MKMATDEDQSLTKSQTDEPSSLGDDNSVYTISEQTVGFEEDEDGKKVKKKKKFRKIRKSLSKGKKSVRNLFSSKSKKKLIDDKIDQGSEVDKELHTESRVDESIEKEKDDLKSSDKESSVELNQKVGLKTVENVNSTPIQHFVNYDESSDIGNITKDEGSALSQIMLLMIEPESGRFEVLQVDLNLKYALVADLLKLIPDSVSEPNIKETAFVGACFCSPSRILELESVKLMMSHERLIDFNVKHEDILLAVPKDMKEEDAIEMAVPILSNRHVASALGLPAPSIEEGLPAPSIEEEENLILDEDEGTTEKANPEDSIWIEKANSSMVECEEPLQSSSIYNIFMVIIAAFLIVVAAIVDMQLHITSPLSPGDLLEAGEWRSQCGLFGILLDNPAEKLFDCNPLTLELDENGALSLYDSMDKQSRKIIWVMRSSADIELSPRPSVFVDSEDGTVLIGGERAFVEFIDESAITHNPFSPWPFVREINQFPQEMVVDKKKKERKFLGIFPLPN